MKTTFWIIAGVYWTLFILARIELVPSPVENIAEMLFWRTIAFVALGYLAGIYERSE